MDADTKMLLDYILEENKRLQKENIELREENMRFKFQHEQAEELLAMLQDIKARQNQEADDEDFEDLFDVKDNKNEA